MLAGLLALMVVLQIMTLRPGHDWGGDFAQYLGHARNLATLHPYADTGYVYNVEAAEIGPPAYPPVFPLLLAPLVSIYGADFVVLKVAMLVLFLGSLMVAAKLFAARLSPWGTVAAVATLAFCPIFWEFNHQILSEHLFVFWWLLAMVMDQGTAKEQSSEEGKPRRSIVRGAMLGLVFYLAMGTRMVGIVLPAALLVTELIRTRRLTAYAGTALGVTAGLYGLQMLILPTGGAGYLDQLSRISPGTIVANLYADVVSFSYVWRNGRIEWLREAAGVLFALVALYGFLRESWPRPQLLAVASLFYFALIVVWPSAAWTRMIWPLLPGFVFWIVYAVDRVPKSTTARTALLAGFLLFTLGSYTAWYAQADYRPIAGPQQPTARELFAQVENRTTQSDVTLFFKPRVLAFFARRQAVGFPTTGQPDALGKTLTQHQVTWAALRPEDLTDPTRATLQTHHFTRVWGNADFELWQNRNSP